MADYSPSVSDLALYFASDAGAVNSCWIPYDVYKTTRLKAVPAEWQMADLLESTVKGGGGDVFYVVNLSRLLGPGVPVVPPPPAPIPPSDLSAAPEPQAKDLVIIPYDDEANAYIVPRSVYSNPDMCPPLLANSGSANIIVAALNVGVVLANIPKATPLTGWGCYMLSLISLKSGALPGSNDTDDKSSFFAALSETGKLGG